MARYKRLETLLLMKELGLIPVFYHHDVEVAKNIVCACAAGGARLVEFTNRGDGAFEVFKAVEQYLVAERPEVVLGTGSVVDAPTAAMYIGAGSNFIVSPLLDEETGRLCNSRKVAWCPGCGTVSEIHRAETLGAEICKIFPGGEVGGPAFVKNLRGPCPWTEIMPTGGVEPTAESLTVWFQAGIACAGIGSKLITKELVAKQDYDGIRDNVKKTLDLIAAIRGGKQQ